MKLRLALAAATCLILPLAAYAQPITGPYVSLEGGTSTLNPSTGTIIGPGQPPIQAKSIWKNSYAGVAAVGYGFGDGFRVELSGNYYRNTATKTDDTPIGQIKARGGHNTFGPMLDVLYDFSLGVPVYPYIGAGIGYQYVQLDSHIKAFDENISGAKGSFAYNLVAGVSYPLSFVPGLSLTLEYRFMMITDNRNFAEAVTAGPSGGINIIKQESSHTFLAGVRYQLFQPPAPPPAPTPAPAPMAAPAPAPAKTYLVFFDWDKYNLTPRATQIIAQAASDSRSGQTTTIDVSGYTDTSGTPTYNQGLSQRRAQAVAAQLVTDGVSQSEISIHAYGETHLLVPTGPGVREPQNRRVEIVLQ